MISHLLLLTFVVSSHQYDVDYVIREGQEVNED